MPGGKVHYDLWKTFLPLAALTGAASAALVDFYTGVIFVIAYWLGRYIDPDLDLIGITNAESRMMRELKIFGVALVMWFVPYAYFMRFVGIGRKGHRNFFSHFPGVSTIIRVAWMLWLPLLILWWYYPIERSVLLRDGLAALIVGLTFADLIHYLADALDK